MLRAARDKNPYLAEIGALPNLASIIEDSEREFQNLKKKGYEPLSIHDKFRRAGMEEEYRSLYNFMCTDVHSNKRALINRHAEIADGDYDLIVYMNPPDESLLPILDSAAGLLASATIRLHELLGSTAIAEAKLLHEGLQGVRSRYGNRA